MIGKPAPGLSAHPIPTHASHELPLPVHKRHPAQPHTVRHPTSAISRYVRPGAVIVEIGVTFGIGIGSEDGRGLTASNVDRIFTMRNPLVEIILWRIAGHFH